MSYMPIVAQSVPVDANLVDLHVAYQCNCDSWPLVDTSLKGVSVTSSVNASIDTTNKKYGTGSLLLNGGYIEIPSIQFGFDSWTIEMWVRWNDHPDNPYQKAHTYILSGVIPSVSVPYATMSTPTLYLWNSAWDSFKSTGSVAGTAGTGDALTVAYTPGTASYLTVGDPNFHHIVLQRRNISALSVPLEVWIDGSFKFSTDLANENQITWSPTYTRFGWNYDGSWGNEFAKVNLDNIRITTGVCRYSSDFSSNLPGNFGACAYPANPKTGQVRQSTVGDFYECVNAATNSWRKTPYL